MTAVVLGWGSLIWRPGSLTLASNWKSNGPILPIEFSRISADRHLTLIIDQTYGHDVTTLYADTGLGLDAAIQNLATREGCPRRRIGWLDVDVGRSSCNEEVAQDNICGIIRDWASTKQFATVVWTALPSTFRRKAREDFSVEAAIEYLDSLSGEVRAHAFEYVRRAPSSTETPVRSAFRARFE